MTAVESFDSNKTEGITSKDGADNEPRIKYQVSRSKELLSPEGEEIPSPEQKRKKRKNKGEDKAYHLNSNENNSGNVTCITEEADNVLFLKMTPGRKKQHQIPSDDEDEDKDDSAYTFLYQLFPPPTGCLFQNKNSFSACLWYNRAMKLIGP